MRQVTGTFDTFSCGTVYHPLTGCGGEGCTGGPARTVPSPKRQKRWCPMYRSGADAVVYERILTIHQPAHILELVERERLSWQEMKQRYPDQWLLIVDYETDDSDRLVSGVVEHHSEDMHQVAQAPAESDCIAFRYTGESTFRGLRSYAHRHSV